VIGSFSHHFHIFDWDYILWKVSWLNLQMVIYSIEKPEIPENKTDSNVVDINFSQIKNVLKM
jgi:hypothetical protein